MRLSLEQLKAMSDEELHYAWMSFKFPFESLPGCVAPTKILLRRFKQRLA